MAAIRNLFRVLEIAPTPEILGPVCAKIHSILNPGFHEEATKKTRPYFPIFYWLFNRDPFFGMVFYNPHITRCFFHHCSLGDLLTFKFQPSGVAIELCIKIWLLFSWWCCWLKKHTPFKTKMKFVFIFILRLSFSAQQVTTSTSSPITCVSQSVEALDSIIAVIALPNSGEILISVGIPCQDIFSPSKNRFTNKYIICIICVPIHIYICYLYVYI